MTGDLRCIDVLTFSCHNIGTVLRFRCKSECAILSMPKDAKAHFYDTEHHPFEGGVLCFQAIGQFAGDGLQGHPLFTSLYHRRYHE